MSEEPTSEELASYAGLMGVFGTFLLGSLATAASTGRLPDKVEPYDVVLIGAATHKISRIVARDRITRFLRAPFTRLEESAQLNEVNEAPKGRGLRHSIGELIACPLCIGTWIAGGLTVSTVFAPRATRVITASFTALAISDFLHLGFVAGADAAE